MFALLIIIFYHCFQEELQSYDIEFIIDTSHLLVGINSAANFFLYLMLRKNFRAATWRILTCKRQVRQVPVHQYSTYLTNIQHTTSRQHSSRGKGRVYYTHTHILYFVNRIQDLYTLEACNPNAKREYFRYWARFIKIESFKTHG